MTDLQNLADDASRLTDMGRWLAVVISRPDDWHVGDVMEVLALELRTIAARVEAVG